MGFENEVVDEGVAEDLKASEETNTQTTEAESEKSQKGDSPKEKQAGRAQEPVPTNFDDAPASPVVQPQIYQPAYSMPHLTPQPGAGYYLYQANPQVTPEPPSPATSGSYDPLSFLHQHSALQNFPPAFPQAPPLSPSARTAIAGGIPPPSPLFPRAAISASTEERPIIGMSPQLGPAVGIYPGYGATTSEPAKSSQTGLKTADTTGGGSNSAMSVGVPGMTWQDQQRNQAFAAHASPQLISQGPDAYGRGNAPRSTSFDEMLPPAMIKHQQDGHPFSSYAVTHGSPQVPNSPMYQGQTWQGAFGTMSSPELYQQSPVQAGRPVMPMHPMGMTYGGHRSIAPHYSPHTGMSYYPATSPGPPIQTTASNKGPDGANLFIFHIPNHFTNIDMYNLFCQFGTLLSVRIMVEKDTGRSRGFGFVSYDSPESAAMAIKELNGFAIGNKRLKVQHKQIRAADQRNHHMGSHFGGGSGQEMQFSGSNNPRSNPPLNLPSTPWYDAATSKAQVTANPENQEEKLRSVDQQTLAPPPLPGCEGSQQTGIPGLSPLTGSLEPLRNALPDVHTTAK